MLIRKIENRINNWIKNSDKALLISGVRQAGKTFIIKKCLEENNCDYVEFNLIKEPEIITILANSNSIDDLILRLSLFSSKKLTTNKTIIFFDEIQKYKEIVTKIKFLVEDKRFRYILSGSLLGIELVSLKSAPVGSLESLTMYPLDFEEFLQAFNVTTDIKNLLKKSFTQRVPIDEVIHNKLIEIFNLYLIVGGMPAAVQKYLDTNNINEVITEHNSIIDQYKMDFTQYEKENKKLQISRIYELIPSEINKKNKKFMISNIDKKIRSEKVIDSFTWLIKAGVALPIYNVTEPLIPLKLNEKSTFFKLFLSDVGLLTTMLGNTTKLKILNNDKDINFGAVFENFAAQELIAHGFNGYYYNSKKYGELDFVIEYQNNVLPIEIKSGKDYEKHSALNNVMNIKNYDIKESFVFTSYNVKVKNNIIYYPIYMLMFLLNNEIDIELFKLKSISF